MDKKRPRTPFPLGQIFAGFCPPTSFDRLETLGDLEDDSTYGRMNTKGVDSVMVDSPKRLMKLVDNNSKTDTPKDTTPIKNDGGIRDEPPKIGPIYTKSAPIAAADTTDRGSTNKTYPELESADEDTATRISLNHMIFRWTIMIGILLPFILAYFNRPGIQSMYIYSIQWLDGNLNAKLNSVSPKDVVKAIQETNSHSLADPKEDSQDKTDEEHHNMKSNVAGSASSSDIAGNTSISSPEQEDQTDTKHSDTDDTEKKESDHDDIVQETKLVGNDSTLKETNETIRAAETQEGVLEDTIIHFFKLQTDETGSYLVRCERTLNRGIVGTFVCSEAN
ncbi:MAG: hypothetical protein SGBAC_000229 [Bacillariaceae sp.]